MNRVFLIFEDLIHKDFYDLKFWKNNSNFYMKYCKNAYFLYYFVFKESNILCLIHCFNSLHHKNNYVIYYLIQFSIRMFYCENYHKGLLLSCSIQIYLLNITQTTFRNLIVHFFFQNYMYSFFLNLKWILNFQ